MAKLKLNMEPQLDGFESPKVDLFLEMEKLAVGKISDKQKADLPQGYSIHGWKTHPNGGEHFCVAKLCVDSVRRSILTVSIRMS